MFGGSCCEDIVHLAGFPGACEPSWWLQFKVPPGNTKLLVGRRCDIYHDKLELYIRNPPLSERKACLPLSYKGAQRNSFFGAENDGKG